MDLSVLKTQLENFATFTDAFGRLIEWFPKATDNVFFSSDSFTGSGLTGKDYK